MTAGVRFGDAGVAISADEADCTTVSREPEESIWPGGATKTSRLHQPGQDVTRAAASRSVAGLKLELLPTTYTVVRPAERADRRRQPWTRPASPASPPPTRRRPR